MTAENLGYTPPDWLREQVEVIRGSHFDVEDAEEFGEHYARETDSVASEYFQLYLQNPNEAVTRVVEFLGKFSLANNDSRFSIGILSRYTAEQFGLIINIASLRYSDADQAHKIAVLSEVDNLLADRNSANVPGLTATIRNPQLLRDLITDWDVNWPYLSNYKEFVNRADWDEVETAMRDHENNPLLFSLVLPADSVDSELRDKFRRSYPELYNEGIKTIAVFLKTRGILHEALGQDYPSRYVSCQDFINERIKKYAKDCRNEILSAIVEGVPGITYINATYSSKITDLQQGAKFELSDDGFKIVRVNYPGL